MVNQIHMVLLQCHIPIKQGIDIFLSGLLPLNNIDKTTIRLRDFELDFKQPFKIKIQKNKLLVFGYIKQFINIKNRLFLLTLYNVSFYGY